MGLFRMLLRVYLMLLVTSDLRFYLDDASLDDQWEQWKITHGKKYNNQHEMRGERSYSSSLQQLSEDEEEQRKTIWKKNMHMIAVHNEEAEQGKHSYKLAMNPLGDLTPEEMAEMKLPTNHAKVKYYKAQTTFNQDRAVKLGEQGRKGCKGSDINNITGLLPKCLDYREEGLVTPVKDQGYCGACWAFSAAGALEGQLAKKTGQLLDLSTQNLLDCVANDGCSGGLMTDAFVYVQACGGINSEEDYPYVGKRQQCRYNQSAKATECRGFKEIPHGDERALAEALYKVGPVSVAIDAHTDKYMFYKSGVYYNPKCDQQETNHAVLLVGFDETAEGEKYWTVKNSYGEDWGENGYIRIARDRDNHCGIASDASYPLV